MNIKRMLATLGVLAIAGSTAFAQVGSRAQVYSDMVPPDKGTAEIGLGGYLELGGDNGWALNLRYLPYMNRNLQIGGDLSYVDSGTGYDAGTLTLRADWNFVPAASVDFAVKRTVPYVGLGVGFDIGDGDNDTAFDIHGGVKHFITNDVSIFGELRGRLDDNDASSDVMLWFGINTYLRR